MTFVMENLKADPSRPDADDFRRSPVSGAKCESEERARRLASFELLLRSSASEEEESGPEPDPEPYEAERGGLHNLAKWLGAAD